MTRSVQRWAGLGFAFGMGCVLFPWVGFGWSALAGGLDGTVTRVWTPAFGMALARSAGEAGTLATLGFLVGWPMGTFWGLRQPRLRPGMLLWALPLSVPSYFWALSVQSLRGWLPFAYQPWMDGFRGMLLAMLPLAISLPCLAAWLKARRLGASAIESTWIAGGAGAVRRAALRSTRATSAAGALLVAALVFADSGCDQLMGCHGFSSEVMVAITARLDPALASAKAAWGIAVLLPLATGAAWVLSRELRPTELPRTLRRASIGGVDLAPRALMPMTVGMFIVGIGVPLVGWVWPLLQVAAPMSWVVDAVHVGWERAWPSLQRPIAGVGVALGLGAFLAMTAWVRRGESTLLVLAGLSLAVPSVIPALGWIGWIGPLPGMLDPLRQEGWLVGIATGTRWAPLTGVLLVLGWREISESSRDAARLARVPVRVFARHILFPALLPWILGAAAWVSVLSLADTQAESLLQPPGGGSFTAHIVAVMDNASAASVAALTGLHLTAVGLASALAWSAWRLAGSGRKEAV